MSSNLLLDTYNYIADEGSGYEAYRRFYRQAGSGGGGK